MDSTIIHYNLIQYNNIPITTYIPLDSTYSDQLPENHPPASRLRESSYVAVSPRSEVSPEGYIIVAYGSLIYGSSMDNLWIIYG